MMRKKHRESKPPYHPNSESPVFVKKILKKNNFLLNRNHGDVYTSRTHVDFEW